MSPAVMGYRTFVRLRLSGRDNLSFGDWRHDNTTEGYIVESWGQGFMLGALLIMCLITFVNMRRKVWLHKLILLEVFFIIHE
jgi:hypothetical protein